MRSQPMTCGQTFLVFLFQTDASGLEQVLKVYLSVKVVANLMFAAKKLLALTDQEVTTNKWLNPFPTMGTKKNKFPLYWLLKFILQ